MRRSSLPLALLLLGLPVSAQSGAFRTTVPADFDNNFFPDAVLQHGSALDVHLDVGLFHVVIPDVFSGVRDVANAGRAGAGAAENLVVASDSGAQLLTWTPGPSAAFVGTRIDPSTWTDPRFVARIPTAPETPRGVVGVLNAPGGGYEVRTLAETASGPWTDTLITTTSDAIFDLAVIEPPSGPKRAVLLLSDGVRFVDVNGVDDELDFRYGIPARALTTVWSPSNGECADIVVQGPQNELNAVISPVGGLIDLTPLIGPIQVVAMASGDFGTPSDGITEPVFSYKAEESLINLLSIGDGPDYTQYSYEYRVLNSNTAPLNEAQPGVADFDLDGDDDILFRVESTGVTHLLASTQIAEDEHRPVPSNVAIGISETTGKLSLSFLLECELPPVSNPIMDVYLFRQSSSTALIESTPQAVLHLATPDWTSNGVSYYLVEFELFPGQEISTCATFQDLFYAGFFASQNEEPDGSGATLARFTGGILAAVYDGTDDNLDYLTGLGGMIMPVSGCPPFGGGVAGPGATCPPGVGGGGTSGGGLTTNP